MSHLKIEQNTSSVEVISSTIIDKLYELALSGTLDSSSNLKGNLLVAHAYEDAVTYLTTNYANLLINVTGGAYIRFADSAVASICATNWGDGTGITTLQAISVSTLANKFQGNVSITSFNELQKFINIKSFNPLEFKLCTNLTSIKLDNITSISTDCFNGCIKLSSIENTGNVVTLYSTAFYGCTSLTSIVFNSLKTINFGAFKNCTHIKNVTFGYELVNIYDQVFNGCSMLEYIKCLAVTPPTLNGSLIFSNTNNLFKFYVPDDSVASYKAATNWSTYASRIFSLTQFAIDFPNG